MNEQIDNLIFNTLAAGRDICLPDVGSLIVRRGGAVRKSSDRLLPPTADVVFSHESRGEVLIDIIAARADVSQERAVDIYRQWLQHASADGAVVIGGVGEIRDGRFSPCREFDSALNPEGREGIRISPAVNYAVWSFALLCVLFAVGVAGYIFYAMQNPTQRSDKPIHAAAVGESAAAAGGDAATSVMGKREDAAKTDTNTAFAAGSGSTAAERRTEEGFPSHAEGAGESAERRNAADDAPPEGLNGVLDIRAGYSYAVWGVYTELMNAEDGMRTVNRRFDDMQSRIYHYGRRYMVALCEYPTRSECVRRVGELKARSKSFSEVWVYTDKR